MPVRTCMFIREWMHRMLLNVSRHNFQTQNISENRDIKNSNRNKQLRQLSTWHFFVLLRLLLGFSLKLFLHPRSFGSFSMLLDTFALLISQRRGDFLQNKRQQWLTFVFLPRNERSKFLCATSGQLSILLRAIPQNGCMCPQTLSLQDRRSCQQKLSTAMVNCN